MSNDTFGFDDLELPEFGEFEISTPKKQLSPQEIKRKNMDSSYCVSCGAKTIQGFNHRYCPNECDLKKGPKIDLGHLDFDFEL